MKELERALHNPLLVIGLAALAGWLLGSGIFALPGIALPTPHPTATSSSTPASPATLPVGSGSSAPIATSSGAMPGGPTSTDPLAGWNL